MQFSFRKKERCDRNLLYLLLMSRNLKVGKWTDINILTNCIQNIVHKSAMGNYFDGLNLQGYV